MQSLNLCEGAEARSQNAVKISAPCRSSGTDLSALPSDALVALSLDPAWRINVADEHVTQQQNLQAYRTGVYSPNILSYGESLFLKDGHGLTQLLEYVQEVLGP